MFGRLLTIFLLAIINKVHGTQFVDIAIKLYFVWITCIESLKITNRKIHLDIESSQVKC
jgi:hypothetical protein